MKMKTLPVALLGAGIMLVAKQADAVTLDCTAGCTEQTLADAVFSTTAVQPAGTGAFESFVQIQNNDIESGYNTTVNNVFDNKSDDPSNHELLLSVVPTADINGTIYREFLLDVNEAISTPTISLDKLQLYLSDTPNQSTTTLSDLGALVYDLDASSDNSVLINAGFISGGSGASDLYVYIPETLFTAARASVTSTDPYVYLFSQFGLADAGFEEWGVRTPRDNGNPGGGVPEPATVGLTLLGIGALAARKKTA